MPIKKPIVIKDWQKGIAPSPFEGISDMRNIDISSNPESIQLALRLQQLNSTSVITTGNANVATDIFTVADSLSFILGGSSTGRAVTFSSTGTLPTVDFGSGAGILTAGTIYFLIYVDDTSFKIADTLEHAEAGTFGNVTNAGTGNFTVTTINMGTPKGYTKPTTFGEIYVLDSNGRLWELSLTGNNFSRVIYLIYYANATTNASGNGIAKWKNYIIIFRNQEIDTYGPLTNSRATGRTFYTLSTASAGYKCNQATGTTTNHSLEVMSNDILYFSDYSSTLGTTFGTPYVGAISEIDPIGIGPFDPTNIATYNFTNQALDLPKYQYITDLQEYSNFLMISTESDQIYPWDTISDSFDSPITSPEVGVKQMSVVNNLLYFSVSKTGNIYFTQGTSNCQKVVDLPLYLTHTDIINVDVDYMIPYCNGLLFTVKADNTTTAPINAVWYYDLDLKALNIKNDYSTNLYTTIPGALFTLGGTPYLAGFTSGLCGNQTILQQRCINYTGYVESAIYQIGTSLHPTNLSRISFELSKPLISGQGIKLEQRQTLSDSYTTIGIYDYATYGAIQKFDDIPNVDNAQTVQIKVSLTVPSSPSSVTDTPQLMNITLE